MGSHDSPGVLAISAPFSYVATRMQGLFERGVKQFNGQFFFEAHDTWEELWRETTGPHRLFYQGLIQTAVGFYHLSGGNFKGACSQFEKAIAKLEQYVPRYHTIETQLLVDNVRRSLQDTRRLKEGSTTGLSDKSIPCIQICEVSTTQQNPDY
jgi:predicted metal-dependent hydrolase